MSETKFFEPAKHEQAFFKCGILGFAGAGKSFTAAEIGLGLSKMLGNKKPVFFIDTETGSDFLLRKFKEQNIELFVVKKRAFKDLLPMCREAEQNTDILIVDSVTAFWNDLIESYKKKKNRTFISFPDWGILKKEWQGFTDWYLNAPVHCIICGRAGWIYNPTQDSDGQSQLEKIGTKMKAEAEFGYEPSFLIEMERLKITTDSKIGERIVHRAHILKDRNDILDGKNFDDPKFSDFLPTIQLLNLGASHFGIDTKTTSEEMFDGNGLPEWKARERQKQIEFEEMNGLVERYYPGTTKSEKLAKSNLALCVFDTTSKTKIENLSFDEIKTGHHKIKAILQDPANLQILESDQPDFSKLNWAINDKSKKKKKTVET